MSNSKSSASSSSNSNSSSSSSSSSSNRTERATLLWGCELNQDRPVRSFKPQQEDKPNCKLLLSTICLGEKAKEEMNLVEILPMSYQTSKKTPITIASLQASTLPMVSVTGLELSPPVIFQLRAGSGPVFISGQESYDSSDLTWKEEDDDDDDDDSDEEEEDIGDPSSSEEEDTPMKQNKRPAPQKEKNAIKKKKLEKEEEAVSPHQSVLKPRLCSKFSTKVKSPLIKSKVTPKCKKHGPRK